MHMEEVVVTASRYEESAPDVPAHVTVITKENIEHSPSTTIPDLLKLYEGIYVSDIGGNGRNVVVDVRGFGETAPMNTLVLVDGRRVNQPDLSGVDWFQIPLERVEKIEIVRGGRGSVLYGDNATGGTINILTKEGEKPSLDWGFSGGSYGTVRGTVSAGATGGNASAYLSASAMSTDGYRSNSDVRAHDIGMKTTFRGKDVNVDVNAGYHKDRAGLPGALKLSDFARGMSRTDTTHPDDSTDTEDYYFQIAPAFALGSDDYFTIEASYRKRGFQSVASGDWGNFSANSEMRTVALSPRILLRNTFSGFKNHLIAGIDYQESDNEITNDSLFYDTRSIARYDLGKANVGFYMHDELVLSQRLRLSAGYRHDKATFSFEPSAPRSVRRKVDVYTAAANYAFDTKLSAYLSISRSFRYPVLDEFYSFVTNAVVTSLSPQTSDTYEVGIRYALSDAISGHINLFRTDTRDELFFNPFVFRNENLDGATRREGFAVSLTAKASGSTRIECAYAYLDARIRGGGFSGKVIPNVPEHSASFSAIYTPIKGLSVVLNGTYVGERPFISDFENAFDTQESYVVLNSRVRYSWRSLTFFFDVYNLADKTYSGYGSVSSFPAEPAVYPSPKRNFLVGVTAAL